MNKVILGLIGSAFLSGMLFGAEATDFSKKSNNDLIDLAGKVEPAEVANYNKEIATRIDEMTIKEAKEFKAKLKEQETKVYDNMKVKDFKARQKAIRDAMPKGPKGHKGSKGGCGQIGPHGGQQGMPPFGGPQEMPPFDGPQGNL